MAKPAPAHPANTRKDHTSETLVPLASQTLRPRTGLREPYAGGSRVLNVISEPYRYLSSIFLSISDTNPADIVSQQCCF